MGARSHRRRPRLFTIRTYVVQTFLIPSPSMKPTLYEGNRILVDKLSVGFRHHQYRRT